MLSKLLEDSKLIIASLVKELKGKKVIPLSIE